MTDATGAVVSSARARALLDKKVLAETTTDGDGRYSLRVSQPAFTLTVTAPGLQSASREVRVNPGESFTADFRLAIPAVEQTVTVEADTAKASLDQVPGNTALVEPESIQRSLTLTLKDVLRFSPGVLVQPRFGADESQFSIRGSGLRSNFHERGVNLFINGSPYQDADGFSDFEALELASVRQIEVWKGANALRYGGNTSGGAVNFIPYTGETAARFHVTVEGRSYGFFKGVISSGGVRGPISYYAALSDTEIEGYREHSRQGRQRLYGNLGWRISDATKVRFDLTYVNAAEQLPGALTRQEFLTNPRQADPHLATHSWQSLPPGLFRCWPCIKPAGRLVSASRCRTMAETISCRWFRSASRMRKSLRMEKTVRRGSRPVIPSAMRASASKRAARRAGIQQATKAMTSNASETPTYDHGSVAVR